MLDILNLNRYESLYAHYISLKNEALKLLTAGDIPTYIHKLNEINNVRVQIVQCEKVH